MAYASGVSTMTVVRPQRACGTGVLVLAGSSGAVDIERAELFAAHGAVALALRWFGGPSQQPGPWHIPLETFTAALDVLALDVDRLTIVGASFGAEAALCVAATDTRIDAVVAISPSPYVWPASDDPGQLRSHWTRHGTPLPFVPFDDTWTATSDPPAFRSLYERSLHTHPDEAVVAAIAVEDFAGQLVLIAGKDDQVWPAADWATDHHQPASPAPAAHHPHHPPRSRTPSDPPRRTTRAPRPAHATRRQRHRRRRARHHGLAPRPHHPPPRPCCHRRNRPDGAPPGGQVDRPVVRCASGPESLRRRVVRAARQAAELFDRPHRHQQPSTQAHTPQPARQARLEAVTQGVGQRPPDPQPPLRPLTGMEAAAVVARLAASTPNSAVTLSKELPPEQPDLHLSTSADVSSCEEWQHCGGGRRQLGRRSGRGRTGSCAADHRHTNTSRIATAVPTAGTIRAECSGQARQPNVVKSRPCLASTQDGLVMGTATAPG